MEIQNSMNNNDLMLVLNLGSSSLKFRSIESFDNKNGLQVLMEDGQMDMLVMLHREKCFLSDLLIGSLTHRMASEIQFPLLVFKKVAGSPQIKESDHLEVNLPYAPANA